MRRCRTSAEQPLCRVASLAAPGEIDVDNIFFALLELLELLALLAQQLLGLALGSGRFFARFLRLRFLGLRLLLRFLGFAHLRSEERRVGKECRSRWSSVQ